MEDIDIDSSGLVHFGNASGARAIYVPELEKVYITVPPLLGAALLSFACQNSGEESYRVGLSPDGDPYFDIDLLICHLKTINGGSMIDRYTNLKNGLMAKGGEIFKGEVAH